MQAPCILRSDTIFASTNQAPTKGMTLHYRRRACTVLALTLSGILGACSLDSYFYQPSAVIYTQPADLGITVENVFFGAPNGPRLHGWWVKARGPARGTVVFAHGNAGNLRLHTPAVKWLPELGYNLLSFDYRGYGQSEGSVTRKGTIEDTLAAIDFATARDAGRVVVFGHSLGGAIGIAAAAERPAVRGVIAVSTFDSYPNMAAAKAPYVAWLVHLFVSEDFDPALASAQLAPRPLLLVHGTADLVVPFERGRALFEQASEPKQFVVMNGGDHSLPPDRDGPAFKLLIKRFLERAIDSTLPTAEGRAKEQQD